LKIRVYIAIPTAGSIHVDLMFFLLNLDKDYDVKVDYVVGGQIAHNRNKLVSRFLKSKYEWLFFIDSDTLPPFDVLEMTKNGKDICSGIYFQWKDNKLIPLVYKKNETDFHEEYKVFNDVSDEELVEVDGVGAGCLLIHRKVFDKVAKPWFLFEYNEDGLVALGEDFYFCQKAQEAGFKVWVDRRMVCSHYKTINLKEINKWKTEEIWWKG
jgi:GT2 family glycosyltransferase